MEMDDRKSVLIFTEARTNGEAQRLCNMTLTQYYLPLNNAIVICCEKVASSLRFNKSVCDAESETKNSENWKKEKARKTWCVY